jgi:putative Mn2+ efflux pump MntP
LNHNANSQSEFLLNLPFEKIGGIILILLGIWFLYRHYKHHHFHLDPVTSGTHKWVFGAILLSMFLSPCMEIVGYFFTLAPSGFPTIVSLILVYAISTWISILTGVFIGYHGMKKLDAHKWEHNSGIITSAVIILSGIILLF